MNCLHPVRVRGKIGSPKGELFRIKNPDGLLVPCGKCLNCRIKRSTEWTIRCLHELWAHDDAVFVTLTYDDDHLPPNGSLVKSDLQKFFKRLRRMLGDRKIRYYACGEYGENSGRPHYHAIIFGLSLRPADKQFVMDAWSKAAWNVSAIRKKSFGDASPHSIEYVAKYIGKSSPVDSKISGGTLAPIFKLCSVGLGRSYVQSHADRLRESGCVSRNGVALSLPRYYMRKLGLTSDEMDTITGRSLVSEALEVQSITGKCLTEDDAYKMLNVEEYIKYDETIRSKRRQHNRNLRARIDLHKGDI